MYVYVCVGVCVYVYVYVRICLYVYISKTYIQVTHQKVFLLLRGTYLAKFSVTNSV